MSREATKITCHHFEVGELPTRTMLASQTVSNQYMTIIPVLTVDNNQQHAQGKLRPLSGGNHRHIVCHGIIVGQLEIHLYIDLLLASQRLDAPPVAKWLCHLRSNQLS